MREGNERDRESLDLRAMTDADADADADADTHLMTTLKTGWAAFMNTGNGACMSVPAVAAPAAPPSPATKITRPPTRRHQTTTFLMYIILVIPLNHIKETRHS